MAVNGWMAIDDRTWRFEDKGVRFFLLVGTQRALLLDSGMTVHDARERAAELTSLPLSLLNTHADMDHVGSDDEFDQVYVSPCELVHPNMRDRTSTQVVPLWDGDVLDLGNRELEIIALPGHTPGSVAVLDRTSGMLFSGDPIQRDGSIFMFGPMRSVAAYVHGLKRLRGRVGEISSIWPCHATCPVSTDTIDELIAGVEAIERGEVDYVVGEMHGTRIRSYDVGVSVLLLDA